MRHFVRTSLFGLALIAVPCVAQQTPLATELVVGTGLFKPVWLGSPAGDDRLFIMGQKNPPIVQIFKNGALLPTPFLDLTAKVHPTGNERGLLGMAFHPDYANNGFFYVNYTQSASPLGATVVERYQVSGSDPDVANPASGVIVLGPISQPQSNHNGGCIAFGADGNLYVGMGDGGNFNDTGTGHAIGGNAQSGSSLLGKMLRIGDDGSIPSDNPFRADPNTLNEIWALGLRNPWRFSFDRLTGDLWIGDVGQNSREEVDFEPAASAGGLNWGWRCMEGFNCTGLSGCTCGDGALIAPVHDYGHLLGCAITGGFVYRGQAIPDLAGTYFFADFCSGRIWSMDGPNGAVVNRTAELAPGGALGIGLITSFGEDSDGELYILDQGGEVFRVIPGGPFTGRGCALAGVAGEPVLSGEGTLVAGSAGALNLTAAAPSAPAVLWFSLTEGNLPFMGGVLKTFPIVLAVSLGTDAAGELSAGWTSWPAGVPSGSELVFQVGILDGAAVKGAALSNALKAITP